METYEDPSPSGLTTESVHLGKTKGQNGRERSDEQRRDVKDGQAKWKGQSSVTCGWRDSKNVFLPTLGFVALVPAEQTISNDKND